MNKNVGCPKCHGSIKPIISIKNMECEPGTPPKFEMYVSGYECDDCGYQANIDDSLMVGE